MVCSAQFFYYCSSGAWPQKMSQIGQQLTMWWPNQSSVFEKVKPHRARILFWKLVKTSQNGTLSPYSLFGPQLWLKWSLPPKNGPNRTKIDDRFGDQNKFQCSKKLSLIERGYFFKNRWLRVQNGSLSQFFQLYPQLWLKWSLPTKNEPNRTKIDDLVTKTKVRCSKNLSLIERGYFFFENR